MDYSTPKLLHEPGHQNWPAHEGDMKEYFGLPRKAKWPDNGMDHRRINSVMVWVLSKEEARRQHVFHRARAACPKCGVVVSAGRLFQHLCGS